MITISSITIQFFVISLCLHVLYSKNGITLFKEYDFVYLSCVFRLIYQTLTIIGKSSSHLYSIA